MFHSVLAPSRLRAGFSRAWLLWIATSCALTVNAQTRRSLDMDANNVGNGGAGTIAGHIYYPGGRPFDQRIQVRLQSMNGEQVTFSNENGAFAFARLTAGTYSIQLEAGKEYEPVKETTEILGQRRNAIGSGQVVPVYINLKLKVTVVEKAGTIDASLAGFPDAALKLYKDARALAQSGEREKAIEILGQAIEKYPTFMMAYNEKGFQYLQLNHPEKALEPLEAAIRISPEAFTPRLNYGVALLQTGSFIGSILELQHALENHDSSCYAHLYLGVAFLNIEFPADAERELGRAIQIGGDEAIIAHRYLGGLYARRGDKLRAADELEAYLRLSPKAADGEHIRKVIDALRKGSEAKK
jgi:tetratricopeptide (TPR) repeat protein